MDYYIIRIYRREKGDPDGLVGTVEPASSQDRTAFTKPEELWDILRGGKAARTEERRERRKKLKEQ